MNYLHVFSLLTLCVGLVGATIGQAQSQPSDAPVRTHEEFTFVVSAPYADVFPLFGAHKETVWSRGFDPQFLYPVPPHDEAGMVFTTVQEGVSRVWVNTAFDVASGHVQYVYWIADQMTAWIDLHVMKSDGSATSVHVVYERTALRPEANALVMQMAHTDANSGPHWAEMINSYLQTAAAAGQPK
jgi:hypothetical protein